MSGRLPRINAREVIRALERAGFFIHHTTGSHYALRHPDRPSLRVTVPYHSGDLYPRLLHSIIKQAGMTVKEFSKVL